MTSTNGLMDAAAVLDDQAAGRMPDRGCVLTGALALDALCHSGKADRDLLDADAGLQILVTDGLVELDDAGRARAAHLADAVRNAAQTIRYGRRA